jgi:hypothetical protein
LVVVLDTAEQLEAAAASVAAAVVCKVTSLLLLLLPLSQQVVEYCQLHCRCWNV